MGLFTVKCTNPECEYRVRRGAKYCPKCGSGAPAGKVKCGSCGEEVRSSARFCWNCGTELAIASPPKFNRRPVGPSSRGLCDPGRCRGREGLVDQALHR